MEDFFKNFANSKIPTLILLGIFFYTGAKLLTNANFVSTSGIAGSILLCIGVVLAFISFVDYRYKENSAHIIDQQGKALDNLGKALKNTGNTHNKMEKLNQTAIANNIDTERIGKKGQKQYSIEDSEGTPAV